MVAFGSFDIIHPGHLHYLREASSYGSLVVVVARDRSIEMLKGRKTLMDEASRLDIIRSLRFVDKAMLGGKIRKWDDMYKILLKVRPDVIAFGYDQKVDTAHLKSFLAKNKLNPKIVFVRPFRSSKYKSSKLKKLIAAY